MSDEIIVAVVLGTVCVFLIGVCIYSVKKENDEKRQLREDLNTAMSMDT